jgi:hypothetical protein
MASLLTEFNACLLVYQNNHYEAKRHPGPLLAAQIGERLRLPGPKQAGRYCRGPSHGLILL